MTNFEKIKQMTVEEMSAIYDSYIELCEFCGQEYCNFEGACEDLCKVGIIKWLESEYEQ